MDMLDFVTFALMKVQHSVTHRPKMGPILQRETMLSWSTSFSVQPELWSSTRTLKFVCYKFTAWRCPRFRRQMRSCSIFCEWNAFRYDPGRIVRDKITEFCSTSDCVGFAWSRNGAKQGVELSTIEDSCKTSYWSDVENSKLQGSERSCGKRISNQESERKESLCWEEGDSFTLIFHHVIVSQKKTCSFSHDLASGNRGGAQRRNNRPLPHQIRRPRLTARKKNLKLRQQRWKLFRQKEQNSVSICWHPPIRQNYTSETGYTFGNQCHFRQVEADEKPSNKSKKGGAEGPVALSKESIQLRCVSQGS